MGSPILADPETPIRQLATILSATELGDFDAGKDVEYFNDLKAFATIVVSAVLGEHFDYDNAVPADVDLFVAAFDRGRIGGERDA